MELSFLKKINKLECLIKNNFTQTRNSTNIIFCDFFSNCDKKYNMLISINNKTNAGNNKIIDLFNI